MKIPSNIIILNKYTIGNEFSYADSYENYQGYYYEINDKYFEGKTFDPNAKELLKLSSKEENNININPKTKLFSKLLKIVLPTSLKMSSILYDGKDPIRYFIKQTNTNPIFIKEVDKNTFNSIKENNPFYEKVSINLPSSDDFDLATLDEAEKQMSGIKTFILG